MFTILMGCFSQHTADDLQPEISIRPEEEQPLEEEQETLEDIDQDGFMNDVDCDDWNPNIYPGAVEILNDEDDDCDGFVDGDGIHSGVLLLDATAIYQGSPHLFQQECEAEVSRMNSQVQIFVYCDIDLEQERADLLLGEEITIVGTENFVFEEYSDLQVAFQSTGEQQSWTAQGNASLSWSSFATDQSRFLSVTTVLDARYLDIKLEGLLTRQENYIE